MTRSVASSVSPTIAAEKQRVERDICDPSDRWEEKELGHYVHLLGLFVAIPERSIKCATNYIHVIKQAQSGRWCSRRAASATEPLIDG